MRRILFMLVSGFLPHGDFHGGGVEATKDKLNSGSTFFLDWDGASRMVNVLGKAVGMDSGVEMEAADGKTILMKRKIWIRWGGPGKGGEALRAD